MSIRIEKNDIVIEIDQGIADSPHLGTADLRSINTGSVPGEASVNFKTVAMTAPPTVSALAFTVNTTTDVFTVASTSGWYNAMAITLNSVVTSTGLTINRVYWIGDLTATTFKLYTHPRLNVSALVNPGGSNGSGTLSTYTFGAPVDSAYIRTTFDDTPLTPKKNLLVILDNTSRAWWVYNPDGVLTNNLVYLGNTADAVNPGRAIASWQSYIIVFRGDDVVDALRGVSFRDDAVDLTTLWTYDWGGTSVDNVSEAKRATFVGTDDILYFNNGTSVGSIQETSGDVFDPTDPASFTINEEALDLPTGDSILSFGEVGEKLLIGTFTNKVYPWDRISPSFDIPIDLPEDGIYEIVSVNSTAYLFVGNRGRIYETNGAAVSLWKKIPDHLSGVFEPYYIWQSAEISRGQIYVGFTATQNDGTVITSMGGVWAIDLDTKALRHVHQLSHGGGGTTSVIQKSILSETPAGSGLYIGWTNSAGTGFGVDTGSSLPYSGGETIIETEIIPIGNYTFNVTPSQYEFKLSRPLVDGESIELLARTNLTESYISAGVCNTIGALSDEFPATTGLENTQWIQMKAILTSTNTTPSRVPLKQFRISTP